jgi:hypothetical protein
MPSAGKRRHKVQLPLTLPWFPPSYHLFWKHFAFCRSPIFLIFFWAETEHHATVPGVILVRSQKPRTRRNIQRGVKKHMMRVGGMIEFADCFLSEDVAMQVIDRRGYDILLASEDLDGSVQRNSRLP